MIKEGDTMRILIIEDEFIFLQSLQHFLGNNGYAVDGVMTLAEAKDALFVSSYDLILLDVNLPDGNGFDFCTELRTLLEEYVPIIMITARDEIEDRIWGLDSGADDYLIKPINFDELRARIQAVFRRVQNKSTKDMTLGDVQLIPSQFAVVIQNQPVKFYMKEYEILYYLFMTHPTPQTVEQIIEHVWNDDVNPFSNSARVHIGNIRKKMRLYSQHVTLQSRSKVGYYLCIQSDEN